MLKTIFLVICLGTFAPGLADEKLLGKGLWSLISIGECSGESLTKELFKADVKKHKLNRTQDGISVHVIIREDINESYWIYIGMCKYVDGGCKPFAAISSNLVKFCDKYAKEHVMNAIKMSNMNTNYFPLPKGEYDLKDYMLNYCNMFTVSPLGRYEVLVYLIVKLQRVACLKTVVEFKKCEDDEDCCVPELVAL